ncbi:E3 ubiquitin-protein ligase SINAT2 [Acorus calamus]|uniref:RING-type E3 ubiquitin transferase n=1 Tax=Acorus calamus TaxID=4465 RepID=A0AAV9CGW8_ACOCL|nr:E3 ubiquitin-protein ligase SINAT2 [Acorus calamus]
MDYLKLGKKPTATSLASCIHSKTMDDSSSLPGKADSTSSGSNEEASLQSKLIPGKQAFMLPNSDINRLLECPVCSNSMYPPIQQCPSGHTLCFDCKSKVNNKCPVCRKDIGSIRCLALEKLALSLHLPCSYHYLGCEEMFPYYSKKKHEMQCAFRPYTCPHPGSDCTFKGVIPTLLAHLKESHKVDLQVGSSFNHRYVKQDPCSVDSISWTLTLFNCFGHYFCLHFEAFPLGNKPVYMAFLRFMGEESEARRFGYSLEVGGNGRKQTWQGVPRSIRSHHRTVRDSHDGLIIPRSLALYFSGGDGNELKLRVTGKIWKEI